MTYTVEHPAVAAFLSAWHENGRAAFERSTPSLDYDTYYPKTAKDRSKYIALDRGGEFNRSGVFLLDKATGIVWSIKGYGVKNRQLGHIDALTAKYESGRSTFTEVFKS